MELQPHQPGQPLQFVIIVRLLLTVLVLFSNLRCAPGATPEGTETPRATNLPVATEEPASTEAPLATADEIPTQPVVLATLSLEEELDRVQVQLNRSLRGNIKYTAPTTMELNESFLIELRLNPSLSADELGTEIVQHGGFVTSTADPDVLLSTSGAEVKVLGSEVEITPLMKAVLVSEDPEAFSLQPLHAAEIQPVGKQTTTIWQWLITAKQSGTHRLILVIYRQINIDGKEYWPSVETHQAYIDVRVTFGEVLRSMDWKWIAGILVTALLIPAFWRWIDQRRKRSEEVPKPKSQKKKG
jgi:hypothetical protein